MTSTARYSIFFSLHSFNLSGVCGKVKLSLKLYLPLASKIPFSWIASFSVNISDCSFFTSHLNVARSQRHILENLLSSFYLSSLNGILCTPMASTTISIYVNSDLFSAQVFHMIFQSIHPTGAWTCGYPMHNYREIRQPILVNVKSIDSGAGMPELESQVH